MQRQNQQNQQNIHYPNPYPNYYNSDIKSNVNQKGYYKQQNQNQNYNTSSYQQPKRQTYQGMNSQYPQQQNRQVFQKNVQQNTNQVQNNVTGGFFGYQSNLAKYQQNQQGGGGMNMLPQQVLPQQSQPTMNPGYVETPTDDYVENYKEEKYKPLNSQTPSPEVRDYEDNSGYVLPKRQVKVEERETDVKSRRDCSMDYFSDYVVKKNSSKFEIITSRVLSCDLNNEKIWCKAGSMISYIGNVSFSKKDIFDGVKSHFKEKLIKEKMDLMKCTVKGNGSVYLSDNGKKIIPFFLKKDESIVIDKDNILAFQSTVKYNMIMLKSIGAMMQGGLFACKLSGPGFCAICSKYDPIVIPVSKGKKLKTDHKNTLFWSGNLKPSFATDIRVKAIFGVSSGEEFQMSWGGGSGFVGVSPKEKKKKGKEKVKQVVEDVKGKK